MTQKLLFSLDLPVLDRYLAGESRDGERAAIDALLDRDPAAREFLAALQGLPPAFDDPAPPADIDRGWARMQALRQRSFETASLEQASLGRASLQDTVLQHTPELSAWPDTPRAPSMVNSRTMQWMLGTAAALCLIVVGVMTLTTTYTSPVAEVSVYATRNGQQRTLVLLDGTRVTLNVASQLTVPSNFKDARVVHLSGEGYFDVTHITGAPFVVESGGVRTIVLGTEFSVKSYDPAATQVAVRSGKVVVNGVVLGAGDIAQATPGSATSTLHRGDQVDAALSFAQGMMVLTKTTLREAIPDLNRWYDADIRLGDAMLGDKAVHLVVFPGSIGELQEMLSLTFGVQVVRTGKILTLYSHF